MSAFEARAKPYHERLARELDGDGIPYRIDWQSLKSKYPEAFKAALSGWIGLPLLLMSAFGTANIIASAFGIMPTPRPWQQQLYESIRDLLFGGISTLLTFTQIAIAGWFKDAFFLYARVSSALFRALDSGKKMGPSARPTGFKYCWALLAHRCRHYATLLGAASIWPLHFLGFWTKRLDPLVTYRNVDTFVLGIMEGGIRADARGQFVQWTLPYFVANIVTLLALTALVLLIYLLPPLF